MIYQRLPEEEENAKACPFCGQMVLTDGDPREVCDCGESIFFRALCQALDDYCGEKCDEVSAEFKPVPGIVMEAMVAIAEQVARGAIGPVSLDLSDGSTVRIGRKVSRKISVKAEQVV